MLKILQTVVSSLRVEAWVSKFPVFFSAVLTFAVATNLTFDRTFAHQLTFSILFLIGHMATGYVANDLADWPFDIATGDTRAIHALGKLKATGLFVSLLTLQIWVIGTASNAWQSRVVMGLLTLLHLIYSFPPRFKNQGVLSVLSSALNQWVSPFGVFGLLISVPASVVPTVGILLLWLWLLGCNGAIRHQVRDYGRDRNQTRTFVQVIGINQALHWLKRVQVSCFLLPLVSFPFLLSPQQAFIAVTITESFSVYHTLYYKRLAVATGAEGNHTEVEAGEPPDGSSRRS